MLLLIAIIEKWGTSGCTSIPSSFAFRHDLQQKFHFFPKVAKVRHMAKVRHITGKI